MTQVIASLETELCSFRVLRVMMYCHRRWVKS